jgi:hypothetical protein
VCRPKIEFGTSRTQNRKVIILLVCGLSFKQLKVVHKYLRMAIVRSEHCVQLPFINQFSPRYALFYLFNLISSPVYTYETNKHACVHTHIHKYIHKYIHTYIHAHTHIHIYIHTYLHTYIHTYIHTYVHTYTHTYIHTYIQNSRIM